MRHNGTMQTDLTLEEGICLRISAEQMGRDLAVTVSGGDLPHIGSVALAVPRESLTGDGSISSTVSIINVTGHKDDVIASAVAGQLSSSCNCVVTVTCGIHFDHITSRQMQAVGRSTEQIVELVADWVKDH